MEAVPVPFAVACSARVCDPAAVERRLHRALSARRINSRREFFRATPREAARAMRRAAGIGRDWAAAVAALAVAALSLAASFPAR